MAFRPTGRRRMAALLRVPLSRRRVSVNACDCRRATRHFELFEDVLEMGAHRVR
jgi:hypothetical protein